MNSISALIAALLGVISLLLVFVLNYAKNHISGVRSEISELRREMRESHSEFGREVRELRGMFYEHLRNHSKSQADDEA